MCPCHGGVYYEDWRAGQRSAAARLVSLRVAGGQKKGTTLRNISSPIPANAATHADRRMTKHSDGSQTDWDVDHRNDFSNMTSSRSDQASFTTGSTQRLGISDTWMPMMRHPVPRELAGPLGWWYVFGSASLTLFACANCYRHWIGSNVCSQCRAGVRKFAVSELSAAVGLVYAVAALLVRLGDGGDGAGAHDASVSARPAINIRAN